MRPADARRDQPDIHPELGGPDHQRIAHVVRGIAKEREGDLLDRLARVFTHREDVGQDLGRVELVGQAVPHRDTGVRGQDLDDVLIEPAVFDPVVQAAEHTSGVLDGLLVTHLR